MIEKVEYQGTLYALIIRQQHQGQGLEFFTNPQDTLQMAHFNFPKGKIFRAHEHKIIPRQVGVTQEVLIIKSGQIRVDIYDHERVLFFQTILSSGDIILICTGGHGLEVLSDDFSMVEIKQGPYLGLDDKVIFDEVHTSQHPST